MREKFAALGEAVGGGSGIPNRGDGEISVVAWMDGNIGGGGVAKGSRVAQEADVDERDSGGVGGWVCNIDASRKGEGVFGGFEYVERADLWREGG